MAERKASPRKTSEGKPTPAKTAVKKSAAKKATSAKKAAATKPVETNVETPEATADEPRNPDPTWPKLAPPDHPGFVGSETDPTPNENYTIAGVTAGAATPETDDEAAATVRQL